MAQTKIAALVTFSILFLGVASGLSFNVQIDSITSAAVKDVNFLRENQYKSINASVENTGSIGCQYRLKADYRYRNGSFERFSSEYPLWPGEESRTQIDLVVQNYTGEVEGNLSLSYCGQEKEVTDFSFNASNVTLDNEYNSKTVEVNSTAAEIKMKDMEEGSLVPVEAPPYWKTASEEINGGRAVVRYDAPIFTSRENISYAVIQDGEVLGQTEVSLKARKTLWDRLSSVNASLLYTLILALAGLNILQYLRGRKAGN